MCWTGPNKELIAKEDIKVKKVLNKDFTAYFQSFRYHPGETYKTTIYKREESNEFATIYDGFHSYSYECPVFINFESTTVYSLTSFKYIAGKYNDSLLVVDFIIPKGSGYYVNEYGEYVSSQIKCVGNVLDK